MEKNSIVQYIGGLLLLAGVWACQENTTEKKNQADTVKTAPAKSEKVIYDSYTEVYDTIFYSAYGQNIDEVYNNLVKGKSLPDSEYWNFASKSSQGKIFIQKMKEVRRNQYLITLLGLPKTSIVVEYKDISASVGKNRMMIIWMNNPLVEFIAESDDLYTCPEYTKGKVSFSGDAWISLVDISEKKIINTFRIEELWWRTDADTTDNVIKHEVRRGASMPVSIVAKSSSRGAMGGKYFTIGGTDSTEGKAEVMHLLDYNKDGLKHEFALFENYGCAVTISCLYGYSVKQDKVIRYEVELNVKSHKYDKDEMPVKDTSFITNGYWIDGLFTNPEDLHYPYKYTIDLRGRGGSRDRYVINYNARLEKFEGELDARVMPEDTGDVSWVPLKEN